MQTSGALQEHAKQGPPLFGPGVGSTRDAAASELRLISLRQLEQMAHVAFATVVMSFEVPFPALCCRRCPAALLALSCCKQHGVVY